MKFHTLLSLIVCSPITKGALDYKVMTGFSYINFIQKPGLFADPPFCFQYSAYLQKIRSCMEFTTDPS